MAATKSSPFEASNPVTSFTTANIGTPATSPTQPEGSELYPAGTPQPQGTLINQEKDASKTDSSDPTTGVGVEGELTVWEARYSKLNFVGRIVTRVLLTVGWAALAYYTWGMNHLNLVIVTKIALGVLVLIWASLVYRMVQAHFSHFYRLTNRRLFVSTGLVHRRRDMMELLRVKDVFARQQSLIEQWLNLGTVVVVPTEKDLPTFYLAGLVDPKEVMDLIWHHARAERDERSVKVDSVWSRGNLGLLFDVELVGNEDRSRMPTVTVEGVPAFEVASGTKLVLAIEDAGVDILHRCGGNARCTTCRVQVVSGDLAAMGELEKERLMRDASFGPDIRLSCQVFVESDMTIRVISRAGETGMTAGPRPID